MVGNKDFATYLRGLVASWEGLAQPRADARVVHGDDFVAALFPEPYLNNAIVFAADAIAAAARLYPVGETYALWCLDDDQHTAAALGDAGYVTSETTLAMVRFLDDPPEAAEVPVVHADLARFADLIGLPLHVLSGVPGLRAYTDAGYESGLVLQDVDDDVYVSMVFTRPAARGHGLATAVLKAALCDAYDRGARTATLQSTPMAEPLYLRHGFRPVGRWQEWVLASD